MRSTFVLLASLTMSCSAPSAQAPRPEDSSARSAATREESGPLEAEAPETPSDPGAPPRTTESSARPEDAPDASAPAEPESEAPPPPPLPEGTVVLHVGSSTAGALGIDLKKEFEERGIRCLLRFKESTFIPQWAGEEMGLRKLVANYDPDLVIISLGGNEVTMPNPGMRANAIRRIVGIVGDRPCLWIGTPKWEARPHTGILDVIRDNSSPCHYVDTDAVVPNLEPLPDGIHPTFPERRRWARTMIQWLEHNRDPEGEHPWSFKEVLELPPQR